MGRRERKNDDIYLVVVTADAGGIFVAMVVIIPF
ncbi:hypothetical protein LTSEMON_3114, partial [Salmonella enterica subsp. enterica serovar Montevideo str. S5-403]